MAPSSSATPARTSASPSARSPASRGSGLPRR
jgi:hypothetical protein